MSEGEVSTDTRQALQDLSQLTQRQLHETSVSIRRAFTTTMERMRRVYEGSTNPQEALARLVADERRDEVVDNYRPFIGLGYNASQEQNMNVFKKSPLFTNVMETARRVVDEKRGKVHPGEFAGAVFESLGYGIVAADEFQKGNLVLSPEATYAFCRDIISPHRREEIHDFTSEIRHGDPEYSYVPDGLVVGPDGKIRAFVEYKVTSQYIGGQLRRSQRLTEQLYDKGLLSREDGDPPPTMIFVTLKGSSPARSIQDVIDYRPLKGARMKTHQFGIGALEPLMNTLGIQGSRYRMQRPG